MHADRLFSTQHTGSMSHHAGFVQGWLSVENEHVSITQMSKHLLVDSRSSRGESTTVSTTTVLRREQLIGNGRSLFYRQLILCIAISTGLSSSTGYTKYI
jgi:hypothetical protein